MNNDRRYERRGQKAHRDIPEAVVVPTVRAAVAVASATGHAEDREAAERKEGAARHDTAAFYAARFAVKEAVYKALGWHNLDLREIESLHRENGSPYVFINQALFQAIDSCRIVALHLSVTTEGDTAAAFVVAEKSE